MSVGYSALCFNAVVAALRAAAQANTIAVDEKLVLPAVAPVSGMELPNIMVSLPPDPYAGDTWGGSGNLKNGFFKVHVNVYSELIPEQGVEGGTPYGSSTQQGILVLSDQVQDALDVAYQTLLQASPRVVDVATFAVSHGRSVADARQLVSVVSVIFKIRFFAGGRS